MECIVQKYGGSSLATPDKIKKIATMIAAAKLDNCGVAVVVSAMGKMTDNLVEMARSLTTNPSRREMDMLLSTGERITMSLLCMALHESGVPAVSLTGSQSGIITNDRHNNARVIEVRPFRVQDEMEKGNVVVIGGFQGVSYKRDITTLGRGGSDTTAVALAAALNASRCEIYSDIDGVYSSDPSVIPTARHLPELSYHLMQEMSCAGAKVLNAHAVQFAKEKQIALYARSTFDKGRETIVRKLSPGTFTGVQAVVSESDIVRVRFVGKDTLDYFAWTIAFLEKEQVSIKELHVVSETSDLETSKASFLISPKNIYRWKLIYDILCKKFPQRMDIDSDLSAVSLIGEGLNQGNTLLLETMSLLSSHTINIAGIATTSFRISLLIPNRHIRAGTALCHKKWVEETL